jgi:hypothetical protein
MSWGSPKLRSAHHLSNIKISSQVNLISYYGFKRNTNFLNWYKMWLGPEEGQNCALHIFIISLRLTFLPSSFNFFPSIQRIQTGHENSYTGIGLNKSINPRGWANFDLRRFNLCSAHRLNISYTSAKKIQSGHKSLILIQNDLEPWTICAKILSGV